MNKRRDVLKDCLSESISRFISKLSADAIESLEEVRIRTGRGVTFKGCVVNCKVIPDAEDMKDMLLKMNDFSIYAHMEQLKQGFITLTGGHRVGIAGRCIVSNGKIENITEISSICIRMAKQIKGVADNIIDIVKNNNVLVISPPGCGKTTLLRDVARQLSNNYNISLIDERCELAACVNGVPQLDVGQHTDVVSNISKSLAIPLLVRSMAPDIIMTDELSGDDIDCISNACRMGVKVIATVHGKDIKDVKSRMNTDMFDKIIILDSNKRVSEVL